MLPILLAASASYATAGSMSFTDAFVSANGSYLVKHTESDTILAVDSDSENEFPTSSLVVDFEATADSDQFSVGYEVSVTSDMTSSGVDISGTVSTVKSINSEDLSGFVQAQYNFTMSFDIGDDCAWNAKYEVPGNPSSAFSLSKGVSIFYMTGSGEASGILEKGTYLLDLVINGAEGSKGFAASFAVSAVPEPRDSAIFGGSLCLIAAWAARGRRR